MRVKRKVWEQTERVQYVLKTADAEKNKMILDVTLGKFVTEI
jgi:hypothetical protein